MICASQSISEGLAGSLAHLIVVVQMPLDEFHLRSAPASTSFSSLDVQSFVRQSAHVAFRESHGLLELDVATISIPNEHKVRVRWRLSSERSPHSRGAEQGVDRLPFNAEKAWDRRAQ